MHGHRRRANTSLAQQSSRHRLEHQVVDGTHLVGCGMSM